MTDPPTVPDGDLPEIARLDALHWGGRYWDGTVTLAVSRAHADAFATGFKAGAVEIVHRHGDDAPWTRDQHQPHTPSERMDQLAAHIDHLTRLNNWRGAELVRLGQHPNPPKEYTR